MSKNPFLKSDNKIADQKNTQKTNLKNPFIEAKKESDAAKKKKTRKSILFYVDDYEKIVALSKTRGETIVGLLTNLVDKDISSLNDSDKSRYDNFLK